MAEAAAKKTTPQRASNKANAKLATKTAAKAGGPLADALNEAKPGATVQAGPSILNIEVEVQFVLGHARVSVGTLMDMATAHVLVMDRAPGDPVDVVVNGTRVARGELVGDDADDGELGVRITQLCDAGASSDE